MNNDTVVPPNAIFWLRMGLYENEQVGAVGSVSNHVNNDQMVKEKLGSCEEYYAYGMKRNIPMLYPYEKKAWLTGFAVMFKREVLEKVGYLDERFSPGNYEDNDLGFCSKDIHNFYVKIVLFFILVVWDFVKIKKFLMNY